MISSDIETNEKTYAKSKPLFLFLFYNNSPLIPLKRLFTDRSYAFNLISIFNYILEIYITFD